MSARMWVSLAIVIAAIAAAGWWFAGSTPVSVTQPVRGEAVQAVYATGNVEATHWAKVTPQVQARIVEHCACENRQVAKGDVLARLDDQEARALLAEANARQDFYAQELNRYLRLSQTSAASQQAYQQAASNFAQAKAASAAAGERLNRYVIRAPLDGLVLRRDGEVGELVDAGDILFWVGKPRPLRIEAEVDEEDIPLVQVGQNTLIKSDAFEGQVLDGTVSHITPKGDPVNKNYRVRVALPDKTPLMIGMTTELNIVIRTVADTLLVPAEAVSNGHVWVIEDGRARQRQVTIGIEGTRRVEIADGLTADDIVIAVPPDGLADGDRVRVARE